MRNQHRQEVRKLEKTATADSPSPDLSRIRQEQDEATRDRLSQGDKASGIRVGIERDSVQDAMCLERKNKLEKALIGAGPKGKTNIQKQLDKLQRMCNHFFSQSTGLCDLCGKVRSAHV